MKPKEIIAKHRRRHNIMAGHYWMELANTMSAEITRLQTALEPFANIALAQDENKRAEDMIDGPDLAITPAQVRAARAALGEPQ